MLLVACTPLRARAGETSGVEAIHFEYVAPAGCPDMDGFLGRISTYTTRWTLAAPGAEARGFVVRITQREGAHVGRLDVRAATGETAGRDIEGESCEDTALGLAVAVALAIDPHASLLPVPATSAPPTELGTTADTAPSPSPPVRSDDAADARAAPAARSPSPPSLPAVLVGARAEANGAVSGVLAVTDVFVELEWAGALARVPSLRPALRGGWRNALTRSTQVGQTRAEVDWTAGYLEACPARFAAARELTVEACLGAHLGVLSARAPELRTAGVTRRTWLDYGGLLGARWQPHPHLFVEAVAGVWAPITRDRLRIEPDGLVTRAPSAGISAGIGGGWRF